MRALIRQVEDLAADVSFEARNEVLEFDGDPLVGEANEKVEMGARWGRVSRRTLTAGLSNWSLPPLC